MTVSSYVDTTSFSISEKFLGLRSWSFLESHTRSPYILSLKSNGCIIFIAALSSSKLVVTSKHSLGPVTGQSQAHALVGDVWLKRYLEQKEKTEADLAKHLWDNNWTAVAELCDDSFEEHVLPYPPGKTGLYLHGINTCTKEFYTLPPEAVDAFADEWGFIKTKYITLDSISKVRSFTDDIRKTGTWEGEPLEGFVVRTHITEPPASASRADKATAGMLPYTPGSTFFFKIKFDEPYLMYRDWREVTKSLLTMNAKNGTMNPSKLSRSKMVRPETKVYVDWVIKEIKQNPKAFEQYQHNKGIIKTREMFLVWLASNDGKKVTEEPKVEQQQPQPRFTKTIIVPIAIPGCGKTAVSVALAHIFKFGHTQSDDVRAKKAGPAFVRNVMELLKSHDVVIADKNNHLRQHRTVLREESFNLFKKQKKKASKAGNDPDPADEDTSRARLLALHWDSSSQPPATIFTTCAERVRSRGTNHQTLRAPPQARPPSPSPSLSSNLYEDVIWRFIRESEDLLPSEVDAIIDMPISEGLEESVRRAVNGIVKELGLTMPSEEKVKEGIEKVKAYKVAEKAKKPDPPPVEPRSTGTTARYYAFLPDIDLETMLEPVFASSNDEFWAHLKKGRLAFKPHVTIVHRKELPVSQLLWERCEKLVNENAGAMFGLRVMNVVWDGRVMALTVDGVIPFELDGKQDGEDGRAYKLAKEFVKELPDEERERLHITVGTKDAEIVPFEAKVLVMGWRKGEKNEALKVLDLGPNGITVKARISGMWS
ncbi:RNA ligase [Amanita rubescens]|nr:RNA ligase [Amanita rubescens]